MDKKQTWWQAHRRTTRRLVQLWAALLHNAYLKGFIDGKIYEGNAKILCAPGLNCYSCPGAAGACPLGSLQNALSASGHRAGWYVLGILLLFGVILGRTICGWLCPFGLLQELLHKAPTPKIRKGKVTRALMQLSADSGMRFLTLEVRRSNLPAQSLYHKLGFVDVGYRKRYYEDNREDALIMVCEHLPEPHPEDDPCLVEEKE